MEKATTLAPATISSINKQICVKNHHFRTTITTRNSPAPDSNIWQQLGVKILPTHAASMWNRQYFHEDSSQHMLKVDICFLEKNAWSLATTPSCIIFQYSGQKGVKNVWALTHVGINTWSSAAVSCLWPLKCTIRRRQHLWFLPKHIKKHPSITITPQSLDSKL